MANPAYLTADDIDTIKWWTAGKIEYGIDPARTITDNILNNIISQSEAQIETQLSFRYSTYPSFQTIDNLPFDSLPRQTKLYLTKLIQVYTVIFLLGMDFGRHNGTIGEEFLDNMKKEFVHQLKMQTELDDTGKFYRSALPNLKLSESFSSDTVLFAPSVVGRHHSLANYTMCHLDNPQFSWNNFWTY